MRLLIEGDEAAKVVNGWIQKAGYVPSSKSYDYRVGLKEGNGPVVTVDGIDCDLERKIIRQMELNGVPEFRLKRAGGIRSDKEINIIYPKNLQSKVERGVYQGLMSEVGNYEFKQKQKKPKTRAIAVSIITLISLLFVASFAYPQIIIYPPGVNVQDESVLQCRSQTLDFTGASVTSSCSAGKATINVTGGGSGAPVDAEYWVGAANVTLTAEKDLSGFTGLVLNTLGTPSSKAANTCTNQFARSDNASGIWTCATVDDASVADNITLTNFSQITTRTHAVDHQNGGVDEINIGGLSGLAADTQQVDLQEEGITVSTRRKLNFIGTSVTVADNPGNSSADITVTGGGGGAPTDAQYWVGAAHATLTAEKDLSGFTGLVLNTAGTPSSKAANTCTNQFARSDTASGVWTCATVDDASVADTITLTNITQITNRAISDTTGTLAVSRGGTNLTASADDNVMVGNGTTWETKAVPDCDLDTQVLHYDTTTNAFSCGDDDTSAGGPTTLTSTTTQSDAVIATYTAITGLSFTAAASTNYLIDCYIIHTSTAATTGINFAWDTPASPTGIWMQGNTTTTATGGTEGFHQNSDNVGTSTANTVVTVQRLAVLHTMFKNGTTSATMSLGFTPETANSVSVIAGSVCQYRTF